jgi:DNA-binding NtrC family response regulator
VPFVDTMTKRLGKRDLEIVTAYSGQEALKKLEVRKVDVIILDVKMPGMDGIETLREIKKSHPLVEVIMLTGHATVETGIEGMKLGAFDYLMKPCDIEQLMTKVREAKEKRSKHEEKVTQARVQAIALRRGD